MNCREALEKAWTECPGLPVPTNTVPPATAHWAGFESGFNAAWDVLLSEIRPLVADLSTVVIADQRTIDDLLSGSRVIPDAEKIERSIAAVARLRELVRNENK